MPSFSSKLFWKAFLSLLLALLIWLPVFYLLTVPAIDRFAYEAEESASRNVLDTVAELVRLSHADLSLWRDSIVESRKRDLRNILALVVSWSAELEREAEAGRLTRTEAREQLLKRLRAARYGKSDYIWAIDTERFTLFHPSPDLDGRDAENMLDPEGIPIGRRVVERGLEQGEGFLRYRWRRLGADEPSEKLTFFRYLPSYGLVVATGVYIDDIEVEVGQRRAELLQDLRDHLARIKVARTGYVFIIDGQLNVIFHPDARIQGVSMANADPGDRTKTLGEAFLAAAKRPDKTVRYDWSRPEDPDNFSYAKVAWVYHFPEQDWYLGATAYTEDLHRSGAYLTDRLLFAAVLGLLLTTLLTYFFVRSLTNPIQRLAMVARRHIAGDLAATSDVKRDDEIGELAEAFNQMVGRLRDQIEGLEARVAERTRELARWAEQLEAMVEERAAELTASEAKFRGLVEQSLAGICVVQDRQFRYVNAGFAKLHGFDSPDEIIGRVDPLSLLVEESRSTLPALDQRLLDGDLDGCELEFVGLTRDGARIDIEASLRRFEYEGRSALIAVSIDVTERKRGERAREQALAAAEALSRLKGELIANMSHELRTPIHGIVGLAHIGTDAKDLAKAQSLFQRIAASGERLGALLTGVLDFSDIESGQLKLERSRVELRSMIEKTVAAHRAQALAKGLRLQLSIAEDLPHYYQGDDRRLAQILGILIENAVKFTDDGNVWVRVSAPSDRLVLRVEDTGIGMSAEELRSLFRPFEQLDGSATRRFGGVGLGLALAQRLAVLMGGSLIAESRQGEGSAFTLQLPQELALAAVGSRAG